MQVATEKAGKTISTSRIIPRAEHTISRANISDSALKVLYRLKESGYQAYLVGGGVRDMLLGREPKDFDVATNARPEEIKELFRSCHLIGRRFRLAHVRFGRDIIEVATFRALPVPGEEESEIPGEDLHIENGRIMRDNIYGTVEEDAWRRDFTINSLYYNIADFSVVDYAGGLEDLQAGWIRLIGDPVQRYREDPVRMLRAVRFAAKLGFRIHPDTEAPLLELGHLLDDIPPARLFEEVLKLFLGGCAVETFELLRHYRLFEHLFPLTEEDLSQEHEGFPVELVVRALANTDERIAADKPVTPAFLFAALLWGPMRRTIEEIRTESMTDFEAIQEAGGIVVSRQAQRVALPKRYTLPMREIWAMQPRLTQISGKRPLGLLAHPRFRAAYDFLLLRGEAGEDVQELCEWWTAFQEVNADQRQVMLRTSVAGAGATKKRRRRRRKKPAGEAETGVAAE
ncbi:MAG: polynucleotide adenylyltransferase PcnB [Gammaproteobacteria bacterium]|nr:polynucleotide adenylyltransferase PcnB [Gammaproteobacteria bacterium]